jgi:tetratricopeptide (TPR) repeat protein
MRRALELDPFNRLYNISAYQVYSYASLHDEAMESIRRAKELYPDWDERDAMAWAHYWKGDHAEAIRIREELMSEAENDFQKRNQIGMLAEIHMHAGDRERGRELYLQLLSELDLDTVKPGVLAYIYADLGDKDEAFRLIEKAYEQKDMFLVWLKTWPSFSGSLAGDPRYEQWLKKMGLEE